MENLKNINEEDDKIETIDELFEEMIKYIEVEQKSIEEKQKSMSDAIENYKTSYKRIRLNEENAHK